MSEVIRAVLSNAQHPEYGQVSMTFPISTEDYNQAIGILQDKGVGDSVNQDCIVDEVESAYSVLDALKGTVVNVDQLDYLAKRLDSFCTSEDIQFVAMAHKLELADIKDFINLTFCCQQATVITDFSNLEQIGRDHYMNLNGGGASTEELDNLDGEETARLLIDSGAGVVTPYGVVYDNGMKLEPLYRGGVFPPYLYDTYPLVLEASPLSEPEDTKNMTLLCLPMTEKQLEHALARGGIESVEQMRFKPDLILLQELSILPALEQESLSDLNEMCEAIMPLARNDLPKLGAAISFAKPQDATQVKHLAENLELFDFIPKVKTPAEYGRYMIEESGHFEYDPNLEDFYDFEGYARQRMRQEQGQFVEGGYISYQGLQSLDEVLAGSPTLDEGFQMGGMQ